MSICQMMPHSTTFPVFFFRSRSWLCPVWCGAEHTYVPRKQIVGVKDVWLTAICRTLLSTHAVNVWKILIATDAPSDASST